MENGEEEKVTEKLQNAKKEKEEEDGLIVWDCGSPLYDSFELASFCHLLDRKLMLLPFTKESEATSCTRKDVVSTKRPIEKKMRKKKKMKREGGLRRIYNAIAIWKKE